MASNKSFDSCDAHLEDNSGVCVLIGEKAFDFSRHVPAYGHRFCCKLANAWRSEFRLHPIASTKKRFVFLNSFLQWVANVENFIPQAADFLTFTVSDRGFKELVEAFAERVRDIDCIEIIVSRNAGSRSSLLQGLSTTLQKLSIHGLWPNCGPIRSLPYNQVMKGCTKSLGEIQKHTGEKKRNERGWREEIAAVNVLNVERLNALREEMTRRILKQYGLFQEGQKLLNAPPPRSICEINRIFDREEYSEPETYSRWQKGETVEDRTEALACLLHWLKVCSGGLAKARNSSHRVSMLISKFGNLPEITARLEATKEALYAAHTIILIDTGFNVQTCDDLAADPFVGSAAGGRLNIETISARKKRAKGKLVEAVLSNEIAELHVKDKQRNITGVRVIRMWQEMSLPIRKRTQTKAVANQLWILPRGINNSGPVKLYNHHAFFAWWTNLLDQLSNHKVLGGSLLRGR